MPGNTVRIQCGDSSLLMVARVGGYYGKSFKVFRGVTQGDFLYPTIINVVVDAVVWHWVE